MTMTMTPLIEVRAYKNVKEFELDAQKRLAAGWTLQGQSGDSGHVGLVGAAAGFAVAGLPGMIGLQGMRKGKTVVTWIHPNPSPWQVEMCQARRAGQKTRQVAGSLTIEADAESLWLCGIVGLIAAAASSVIGPLVIVAIVAVIGFLWTIVSSTRDTREYVSVADAY